MQCILFGDEAKKEKRTKKRKCRGERSSLASRTAFLSLICGRRKETSDTFHSFRPILWEHKFLWKRRGTNEAAAAAWAVNKVQSLRDLLDASSTSFSFLFSEFYYWAPKVITTVSVALVRPDKILREKLFFFLFSVASHAWMDKE